MDENIKVLVQKTAESVTKKVKKAYANDFHRFGTSIGIGADGTPTKYVDNIAEEVAINIIKKSKIPINLLSEEIGFINNNSQYTIVLDPIDGTRNACRGIPFYAVSLAVGSSVLSDISYGVVKNIATGDTFIAEKGQGAFLNNRQFVVPDVPDKEILLSLTLGKNSDPLTCELSRSYIIRSLGSASLEMCMVSTGALDGYIVGREFMRVTDIAASTLILREAGGNVINFSGEPLEMPLSLDERVGFIAAGSRTLINAILAKSKGLK
jgi:fructose-1,6-bisphosphatase/inositol monophosphatase family enzyme